jgi:hypothetical protein
MNLQYLARIVLLALCAVQGGATIVLDLNRTHAAHPQWLGHARFHIVWQTASVAILAVFEVLLLSHHGAYESERFYLTSLLAGIPMLGFFAALFMRRIYGGTLSDPGGIPAARFTVRGRQLRIDLNLVAELAGILTLAGTVWLFHWAGSQR